MNKKLAVNGTTHRAQDITDRASICPWNPEMYGVDLSKPGAQEYYDSVLPLIASWGGDSMKVDDIARSYDEHRLEIEAIRRAIDRPGRALVLSPSPGEAVLSAAQHVNQHAKPWRISDAFRDMGITRRPDLPGGRRCRYRAGRRRKEITPTF